MVTRNVNVPVYIVLPNLKLQIDTSVLIDPLTIIFITCIMDFLREIYIYIYYKISLIGILIDMTQNMT